MCWVSDGGGESRSWVLQSELWDVLKAESRLIQVSAPNISEPINFILSLSLSLSTYSSILYLTFGSAFAIRLPTCQHHASRMLARRARRLHPEIASLVPIATSAGSCCHHPAAPQSLRQNVSWSHDTNIYKLHNFKLLNFNIQIQMEMTKTDSP